MPKGQAELFLVCANNDKKVEALQKLQQILGEAIGSGVDSVELEYVDEGLEISFMRGGTGIGTVLGDSMLASELIRLIIEKAKLKRKSRGVMAWTYLGREHNISVEEYESFGESAFRLILRKPSNISC